MMKPTACTLGLLVIVLLCSCSPTPPAGAEDLALAKEALAKDPGNPERKEDILFVLLIKAEDPQAVIAYFSEHADELGSRPMARIYHATALCQLAGSSEKPSEQLKWVRKGIGEFDRLIQDFPGNGHVLLWQSITYSNFPDILGVAGMVTNNIETLNSGIEAGTWRFTPDEMRLLSLSYMNLAAQYKNRNYLAQAEAQMIRDGLTADQGLQEALAKISKELP